MTAFEKQWLPLRQRQRQLMLSILPQVMQPGTVAHSEVTCDRAFRAQRFVLVVEGGPIVDLGRFYAARGYRGCKRRKGKRRSWLTSIQALRVSLNLKIPPMVVVTDIRVGSTSQMVSGSSVPAEVFAPNGMMSDNELQLDIATRTIGVSFHNLDGRVVHIRGAFAGMEMYK